MPGMRVQSGGSGSWFVGGDIKRSGDGRELGFHLRDGVKVVRVYLAERYYCAFLCFSQLTDRTSRLSSTLLRQQSNFSKMARKFIVGGNWKMNGTKKEIDDIVAFLKAGPLDPNVGKYDVFSLIPFPPFHLVIVN